MAFPHFTRRNLKLASPKAGVQNRCNFCQGKHAAEECAEAIAELEQYVSHCSYHVLTDQCAESTPSLEFKLDLARIHTYISRLASWRLCGQDFIPYK
ncbi:hypothetical protein K493DRAFT_316369 [Basidiobolus meristosporus CBS 931.73]|uniref:Uncharacterized protein n=1 Tax=Basidiobolus meristosporus CBS 931.73 TaxID=1314790 RepID=A0A1Y1Y4A8_9FUNG|nr:hypothetical protein K493DRAFT_316369 [Basidiobolus meristosporus CBS 931.73]|eukprot:ORX92813.1 hypothetical protein K493DRAFT_316369 [Basidiobolus meristosporus CBS 931.73]